MMDSDCSQRGEAGLVQDTRDWGSGVLRPPPPCTLRPMKKTALVAQITPLPTTQDLGLKNQGVEEGSPPGSPVIQNLGCR